LPAVAEVDNEPIDVEIRAPASVAKERAARDHLLDVSARIDSIIDYKTFSAISGFSNWSIGEVVAVESQNPSAGIIAFVEVTSVENSQNGTYLVRYELLRHSRTSFVQVGDTVYKLDLSSKNPRYKGTTDLIIKKRSEAISSRYKPLFTQGVNIGETAQTLWENEYLITWYGMVDYGWTDNLTIATILPGDIAGAGNGQFKYKVYQSDSTVLATGLSYAQIPHESRSTLNLNFIWDSISSQSVISHTFVTLALFTFEKAEDATAIKSLGTSSFQTGYEFILDDWDRVLVGPNYNFEKKAVGGYLSYVQIWEKFHFAVSINSTNVASFRLSASDGYYGFFDAYWRF
jgi:hypothetical protein